MKIVMAVFAVLLLIAAGGFLLLKKAADTVNSGEVADYTSRVNIWTEPAGNSSASKLADMNINYDETNLLKSTIDFAQAIVGEEYSDQEQTVDTFTYLYEIKGGYEKDTYEDEPYLIPYLVKDSDQAVIVIPGGGYGYKSMDGGTSEGKDIALSLNKAGINAFVLHYRSNPYEYPIPQLDVQRAVRYLKHHANEYGLNPEKIGLIGFSAGGYQIGSFLNLIQGQDLFPEDYQPDEIDRLDDSVSCAAMIYPALTYRYNVPMLFCSFDAKQVRDEKTRSELLDMTDLSEHFNSASTPQFVSYGTSDGMVNMKGTQSYLEAAKKAGADVRTVVAEGQDHGFSQKYYIDDCISWFSTNFEQTE